MSFKTEVWNMTQTEVLFNDLKSLGLREKNVFQHVSKAMWTILIAVMQHGKFSSFLSNAILYLFTFVFWRKRFSPPQCHDPEQWWLVERTDWCCWRSWCQLELIRGWSLGRSLPGNMAPGHSHPGPRCGDWRRLGEDDRCLVLPENKSLKQLLKKEKKRKLLMIND